MIEKLTADKLKDYGFNASRIDEIMKADYIEQSYLTNMGEYYIVKSDMKIYSDADLYVKKGRSMMFPTYNINLIPDYFRQRLQDYLKQQERDIVFNEAECIEAFKQSEINRIAIEIKENEKFAGVPKIGKKINQYSKYAKWLNGVIAADYFEQDGSDTADGGIINTIENLLLPIKDKCFNADKDHDLFVELLTNFFESKKYVPPKKTIVLVYNCKVKLAKALNKIYFQTPGNKGSLNSNVEYFKVIRSLNHFKDLSNDEIYSSLNK